LLTEPFNEQNNQSVPTIFGTVTTGDRWKFLKLESNTVTIGLLEYNLPPVEQVLGILVSFLAHY
jgi:hypothetical protein